MMTAVIEMRIGASTSSPMKRQILTINVFQFDDGDHRFSWKVPGCSELRPGRIGVVDRRTRNGVHTRGVRLN
jgi:hypothetical protein